MTIQSHGERSKLPWSWVTIGCQNAFSSKKNWACNQPLALSQSLKPIRKSLPQSCLSPVKANLPNITKSCMYLTSKEQAQLLVVLKKHSALFQGKWGEWIGNPVNIEVIKGSTPIWTKPYHVPLKNCEVFMNEIYCQCDIGAFCKLSAKGIKKLNWASPCFWCPKENWFHSFSNRLTSSTKRWSKRSSHSQQSTNYFKTYKASNTPLSLTSTWDIYQSHS